jgi:hypothetical protein
MKAFLLALVAMCLISVAANQILMRSDFSSAASGTSSTNVRLSD